MNSSWRINLASLSFLFLGLILISRLFYWQVLASDRLSNLAQAQQQTTIQVNAQRGEILASDKTPLVTNQPAFQAYFVKNQDHQDSDFINLSKLLAPVLYSSLSFSATPSAFLTEGNKGELIQNTETLIYDRLSNPQATWISLAKKLTQDQKWALEGLNQSSVFFESDQSRLYPEASMAAHLVGFVGSDSHGIDIGYHGLEGFYQTELAGRPGIIRQEKDAFNQPILFGQFLKQAPIDGRLLKTNIDKGIQFLIEDKLESSLDRYGAKAGSVTIMDPYTGAILAMASLPGYDPQEYTRFNSELYLNPVISDAFEPGSIFKVLVMAAALDSKSVETDAICDICNQPVKIDKYTIKTWDDKYRPNASMTDIIVHSDNVGMVFIGQKLGLDKFLDYFKSFGLTKKTNIDLQDEIVPEPKSDKKWTYVDLATASFGQGFVVTGMQLLQAVSAIANGGELIQPQVVNQVIGSKKTTTIPTNVKHRVISKETAEKVTDMMIAAVKEGEAKWLDVKGYKIAGKTGTAQIAVGGKYAEEKTNASFIGFAPADNPKFAMLVTLKEPKSSPWASETAAPLWFSIAKNLLDHYNIVPNQN